MLVVLKAVNLCDRLKLLAPALLALALAGCGHTANIGRYALAGQSLAVPARAIPGIVPYRPRAGEAARDAVLASHADHIAPGDSTNAVTGNALYADAAVPAEARAPSQFRLSAEGAYLYGPVDGHLQTPSGGEPGTTTRDRPTLHELGIEAASIYDAELALGWGPHELFLGGQWFGLSEQETLDDELVSQANTFPAGSRVDADVRLDWYRLGYRYRIEAGDGPGDEPRFVIRPAAGFALLDFDFQLDGPGGAEVSRSYSKGAPQVGVAVEWRATDRFSVTGEVSSTIPLSNTPLIQTAELSGKFRLFDRSRADVSLLAGVAYERIHYADDQEVSNDIDVEAGPLLRLGVEARF
jgi:hypothetical protein